MSGRYPYGKKHKYAHMLGDEAIIWERFIDAHPGYYSTCDYDYRVGEGMILNIEWEDNIKRMATAITQKRIDVLAWVGDIPTIIEVKRRAGLGTLGQLLGYWSLFRKDFPHFVRPKLLLICESIDEDTIAVMEDNNIPVVVI